MDTSIKEWFFINGGLNTIITVFFIIMSSLIAIFNAKKIYSYEKQVELKITQYINKRRDYRVIANQLIKSQAEVLHLDYNKNQDAGYQAAQSLNKIKLMLMSREYLTLEKTKVFDMAEDEICKIPSLIKKCNEKIQHMDTEIEKILKI